MLAANYSYIYVNIAILKEKQGNYTDAEKYFLNGLVLGPNYPSHYELYGEFLYERRRYREAVVMLEDGLNLSTADLDARITLMKTFEALGQWDNLKLLASNTLQMLPDNDDAKGFLTDAEKRKNKTDVEADQVKLAPTAEKYLELSLSLLPGQAVRQMY